MAEHQGPTSQPQGQPPQAQQPAQPPMAPYPYDYRDDEISLYELWNTLVKRRLLIGAVFLLITAVAAAYALTRTPTYQFDAVIEVGQMPSLNGGSLQAIDAPGSLVSRLNEVIIPAVFEDVYAESEDVPPAPEAEILNGDARLVRLFAEIPAERSERMEEAMAEVVRAVLAEHERIRSTRLQRLDARIGDLRAEIDRVIEARSGLFSQITNINRTRAEDATQDEDVSQQLAATLGGIVNVLVTREADADITDLKSTIAQLEAVSASAEASALVRPATLADSPEGQPPTTIIALGAVLGLMLGVFAAFGREFLANAAEQA